jgi:phosphate starvation-inducible PhoH-like protein
LFLNNLKRENSCDFVYIRVHSWLLKSYNKFNLWFSLAAMEETIQLDSAEHRLELFGSGDEHLRIVRARCGVNIAARNENVEKARNVIELMRKHLAKFGKLDANDVIGLISKVEVSIEPDEEFGVHVYSPKKSIKPFTRGQRRYIEAMLNHDLIFCTGPAGTGKTYLAVAVAVSNRPGSPCR